MTDVPQGTAQDVLTWVGDDPARARQALEAELAGPNRSTLIPKLEAIASKEAPMSETTIEEPVEAEEVPAPEQPVDVNVLPYGATIGPFNVRDADVEVPEDDWPTNDPEAGPIDAEQLEIFRVAGTSRGVVVSLNGTAYAMGPQLAVALRGALNQAVTGLTL